MHSPIRTTAMRMAPLATALASLVAAASTQAAGLALGELPSLLEQRDRMPAEFRSHLFGTPLTVRVDLDGRYLGDAEVLLHEDNRVQLLAFTEAYESPWPESERARWIQHLAEPMPLGICASACRGLAALHYSLSNSLLTLLTPDAGDMPARHVAVPEAGSHGLIVRNSVAVHGGQKQATAARYSAELRGSVGRWSAVGSYQYYAQAASSEHYLSALYVQRELGDHFLRTGYFLPTFEGIIRQPRAAGVQSDTALGVMFGSSDVLLADSSSSSAYPVYVTASREGVVEIYRDGHLLSTQGIKPGIQQIDTRRLPGGIYDVELRVIADGQEASRESASIYKPTRWSDPTRRWRYSLFAGQNQGLLNSSYLQGEGGTAAGAVVNYLLHPRVIAGATVQKISDRDITGISLDWQASGALSAYTNFYTSSDAGRGMDLQAMHRYRAGSVVANHGRSWVAQRQYLRAGDGALPRWQNSGGWQESTAVSITHRFGHRDHASVRIARTAGYTRGTGLDVSYGRRETLFGRHDVNWNVSAYDRPGNAVTQHRRQRGIDLTLSLALGSERRSYGGSLGSRTGEAGRRDTYVTASATQQIGSRYVHSLNSMVAVDSTGLGAGVGMNLQGALLEGDVYLNRSSSDGQLSGSANLESTALFGGGHAALIGQGRGGNLETGLIVDVRSDFPEVQLRADDSRGGGVMLRQGRNFVPVHAYRAGHVQFDFHGRHAPAAILQPATVAYHLNKGGVMHATLDVLRTYTVMGQVVDADRNGVRGVHVINHAGRTVSQDDGFFTLELSARAPVVQMQYPSQISCTLSLEEDRYPREGDLLMVGSVGCQAPLAREN